MKKISFVLLGFLLSSLTAFGQARPDLPDFLSNGRGPRGGSSPVSQPLAGPRAYYSLAGHLVPPGARELAFELRIEGRQILTNVLQLPLDAAGGTFELLAGDPGNLERLFTRAEKAGRRAQVVVSLDGRPLRTFAFPEFLAYNRQFEKAPPQLLRPLGEVRTFAPEAGLTGWQSVQSKSYDPVCVEGCEAQRDWCYQNTPECASVFQCTPCDNEFNTCRQYCWVCEDPKSVTTRTQTTYSNAGYRGSACLTDPWGSKWYWDIFDYIQWQTQIQRTEYCNGSVVETVIGAWQSGSGTCIKWTGGTCSFSQGNSAGVTACPF
jgi:hypothetical protein